MITSYAKIYCNSAEQMQVLTHFKWPETIGTHISLRDNDAIITNYFTEQNFKPLLTELAILFATSHPNSNFTIQAWIDNQEQRHHTRFFLIYTNRSLVATETHDYYLFRYQHICLDCGDDITGIPRIPAFQCPHCGVSYALPWVDNAKDIDYIFGQDESTYIIPIPTIE